MLLSSGQSNKTDNQYELNTPVFTLQVFPTQKKLHRPLEMTFDVRKVRKIIQCLSNLKG